MRIAFWSIFYSFLFSQCTAQPQVKMILDADTANEIDDLYAIARLLPDQQFDLLGLSSAQWFHRLSGDSTVYASQQLNEDLLEIARRTDLPHPLGSDIAVGMPWGGEEARNSPAAQFIIAAARELAPGDSLLIVGLGASTNIASAILLAPDIVPKLRVYILGFRYDFARKVWNKDEFNIRRDLNAANVLLNTEDLDLHIMPVSVAKQLQWQRDATYEALTTCGNMGQYLGDRWRNFAPDNDSWIMWDLALVEAILYPGWATQQRVTTPPENTPRTVWMYEDIDEDKMTDDFWTILQKHY